MSASTGGDPDQGVASTTRHRRKDDEPCTEDVHSTSRAGDQLHDANPHRKLQLGTCPRRRPQGHSGRGSGRREEHCKEDGQGASSKAARKDEVPGLR